MSKRKAFSGKENPSPVGTKRTRVNRQESENKIDEAMAIDDDKENIETAMNKSARNEILGDFTNRPGGASNLTPSKTSTASPRATSTKVAMSTAASNLDPGKTTTKATTPAKVASATAASKVTPASSSTIESNLNTASDCIKMINSCLKKVAMSGEYTVEGEAFELPKSVGLEIKDFGRVSLPLLDPQATELIKVCQQAPYGKGHKTLVDVNVRDSFQLDPSLVSIKNPEWDSKLNDLVTRVAKGLGCQAKIKAKLYKLLVYRQGIDA